MVDLEGYVALHTNRYSVPVDWIGRRVEVRETRDKIEIQRDARNLVTHTRIAELYGHQEDAKVGYNPQEPGRPSHAYNSYFIANLRMVIRNRQKSVSEIGVRRSISRFRMHRAPQPRPRYRRLARSAVGRLSTLISSSRSGQWIPSPPAISREIVALGWRGVRSNAGTGRAAP
jgi:hypothetical protein